LPRLPIDRRDAIVAATASKKKIFNLSLPWRIGQRVAEVAKERDTSIAAVLRAYIMLGLAASELEKHGDAEIVFRVGETERRIMLIY